MLMVTSAALAFGLLAQSEAELAGRKALDAGRFEEAEKQFAAAVAADPKDYTALFHLALARTFLNKDAEAMALFEKVLTLRPGLREAHLNLGLLLHRHRQFAAAVRHLEEAARQQPRDERAQYHLAESLRELDRCAEAEPVYRQLLTLDSSLVSAQLGLARCLLRLDRWEEATLWFAQAGQQLELAQAYEERRQWEKAIPLYEAALAQAPDFAVATRLAGAYLETGQRDKAQALIRRALAARPDDFDLRLTLGRLLRDERKFADAAEEFARAAQLQPESAAAWSELAGMLISLNNDTQALAALDRVRALGAETPGHLFFRAVVLDRNRQVKAALAAYQAFLAASRGQYPEEEFKARQRARILEREAAKR